MDDLVSPAELRRRAARIRLVLTDVDGVLTDAGVYYSERGEELKRFNVRDGMGVQLLRGIGIDTGILTRETSGAVVARARKLHLDHVWIGVLDKRAQLDVVLRASRRSLAEVAYIGDDVNDLGVIEAIRIEGLVGCPADAVDAVAALAHLRTTARGGHGAFREFADWIIHLRGDAP